MILFTFIQENKSLMKKMKRSSDNGSACFINPLCENLLNFKKLMIEQFMKMGLFGRT